MTITENQINLYKNHLVNEEKSKITIEKYIRDVKAFSKWLADGELSKMVVLEYKNELIEKYAPATVNSVLASLNGFFEFNERYDLKVKNLKVQKQIFCQKDKELTKAEYERLLTAAKNKKNERLYLVMQTICSCGLRVSELSYITVDAVYSGRAQMKLKGKIRTILLTKELCAILKKYIKEQGIPSGSVFITRKGKPLDRFSIWRAMKRLCKTAGVAQEKVFPHNLRHLFARTYYSLQKDIVRLADILGHSSINTTRIYTLENGDIHQRQMQRLGLACLKI